MVRIKGWGSPLEWAKARFPTLLPGGPAPGNWELIEGTELKQWKGQLDWLVSHGPATVWWSAGKPRSVFNALTTQGERTDLSQTMEGVWRRPRKAPESYIWCEAQFDPDNVRVVDVVHSVSRARDHSISFYDFLSQCDEIASRIRDDFAYCIVLNGIISNFHWKNGSKEAFLGMRDGGVIISKIRDCGNEYTDFYGREPADFELDDGESWPDWREIMAVIEHFGWTRSDS
jgi:hypothetical protein